MKYKDGCTTHTLLQAADFSVMHDRKSQEWGEVFCPAGLQLHNKTVRYHSRKKKYKRDTTEGVGIMLMCYLGKQEILSIKGPYIAEQMPQ